MQAAFIGRVSATDCYVKKETGEVVGSVHVASGKNMIAIRCDNYEDFSEGDFVTVFGDVVPNGREFFVKGASLRVSTPEDHKFFGGASVVDAVGA